MSDENKAGPGRGGGPGPPGGEQHSGEPDLLAEVRETLDDDHPYRLLAYASGLLAALDPPPAFGPDDTSQDLPSLQEIVDSFLAVPRIETTALAHVLAELVSDELLGRRIRRELAGRDDRLPSWLAELAPVEVDRARRATDAFGDADHVVVGVRTASGADLTAFVVIDHNAGSVATDGFAAPISVDEAADILEGFDEQDLEVAALDPTDARAHLEPAVQRGRSTYPPFETDTWPESRPLVEWVVRQLPEGGQGRVRPDFDEDDQAAMARRFFESPFGRDHDHPDARDLLDTLLWYGCDYGSGDPLVWSPTAVEILLADWLPRKIVAEVDYLSLAPDLLRSFVRFAHDERGLGDELTAQTLATVDEVAPHYQRVIRSDRPQGPEALLARMGWLAEDEHDDPFGAYGLDYTLASYHRRTLGILRETVGGDEALRGLSAESLPDESFAWEVVPDDVRDTVDDVVELIDFCCDELFDVEHRTACRRLLADVVAADPDIFGRGRADTAAAAIVWIVGKANETFDSYGDGLSIGEMTDWFGISGSPSSRAKTMLDALGVSTDTYRGIALGSPDYLVSTRRRQIIRRRDEAEQALADADTETDAAWTPDEVQWWRDEDDPWEELDDLDLMPGADDLDHGGHLRDVSTGTDDRPAFGIDPAVIYPWSSPEPVDVLVVGWFPREEFAAAVDRWPELAQRVGTTSYESYARLVQATLLDVSRDYGRHGVLIPLDVDTVVDFADANGLEPGHWETRAALTAALTDIDAVTEWPPGRNDPCWCGSGRKYKRCCDTVATDPAKRDTPAAADPDAHAYELEVRLAGAHPQPWRRLRIAADATFRDLHNAIQVACDWQDYHLFAFSTPDGATFAGAGFDDGFSDPEPEASTVPLAGYFARHDRCVYEYDFGDGWIHDVALTERISEPVDYERELVAGELAFPPEDCGGLPGFEECIEVATGGADHEGLRAWLGDWHPEDFDLDEARARFDY